jgi:hypothetical protein
MGKAEVQTYAASAGAVPHDKERWQVRNIRSWAFAGSLAVLAACAHQNTGPSQPTSVISPAALGSADRQTALSLVYQAGAQNDFKRSTSLQLAWANKHPDDLDFLADLPMSYAALGDKEGWEQSRRMLTQSWARKKGTIPRPRNAGFHVELIQTPSNTLIATQCYERAGRFGVLYKFVIIGSPAFFTVESSDADNKIAKEMGGTGRAVTLDFFAPNRHATVALWNNTPDYATIVHRVAEFLKNPVPMSASPQVGMSTEGCEFAS